MEPVTVFIFSIVVVACATPFVLDNLSQKKQKHQLLQVLLASAESQNLKITLHEHGTDFILAMDEPNRVLFFLRKGRVLEAVQTINLRSIRRCELVQTFRSVGEPSRNLKVTDKLMLRFYFSDRTKHELNLLLFDANEKNQLSGELQVAKKWEKLIND